MNEVPSRHGRPRLHLACGQPDAEQIADTVGAMHLSPDEWITRFGIASSTTASA